MTTIKIKIYVPELKSTMQLFDRIEVQRSVTGSPYSDAVSITKAAPEPATLLGTVVQPYMGLYGTQFKLRLNSGTEMTVPFTSSDPVSIQTVVDLLNMTVPGLVASDDGAGKLNLVTGMKGTRASLEITNGSANAALGFVTGQSDSGEDKNIQLMRGVSSYSYEDRFGAPTNYYRTRYLNSFSGNFSDWSDWILGVSGSGVQPANLIFGIIKLAGVDGAALVNAKVTVVNVYNPIIQDGYFIAGRSKTVITDGIGQAQVTLVRGSTIDVIVEGTTVVRRILVPSVGTSFDLLDPTIQTDDAFGIQVPDLPAAPRSS
jgi:hypothetical protein